MNCQSSNLINNLTSTNDFFKFKSRYSDWSILIIFLISPPLVIIEIFNRSIKNDRICQFCLAVFIGLISVLAWPPRADVYRHAMTFYEIQGMPIEKIIYYYYRGGDIILLLLQVIFGKLGLNFEMIRFIFVFFPYILFFNLYNIIVDSSKIKPNKKAYLFFIVLLSVPLMSINYALRYGLSMTILAYCILKEYITGVTNVKDYILFVISLLIHIGSAWLIATILISKIVPNRLNKLVFVGFYLVAYLIANHADMILRSLPLGFYGDRLINFYLATEDIREKVERNFIGLLPTIINYFFYYAYLSLVTFIIPYNKRTKIIFLLFIICAFTSGLPTLSGRINCIIPIIGGLFAYYYINWKKILCYLLIFTSCIPILTNWRSYLVSHVEYIFTPVPIALSQSYSYHWLRNNLTEEGTLMIYKH